MYSTPKPPKLSDSNRRIFDNNASTLRLYQVWKGSNKFCFGGRLIFGPDVRSVFLTLFLILTPAILFCGFVSQSLIKELNHDFGNLIVTICALFTLYVVFLLFLTSGRDPGIIPRNSHPPEIDEDGSTISTDWLGSQNGVHTIPPTRDVIVNGMIVKVKYCQTCMLYRPPRCSHCSICNNCVERFDHHCPWVGQCIGKTTYENFRYRYHRKMNPYNRGCLRNIVEIFFSKIPSSKNNFRSKVKVDSSAIFAMSLGPSRSPAVPKRTSNVEMGKRQAVAAEDLEDIQSQLDSVGGLHRCRTQPRHASWDLRNDWENTSDMQMLAVEFGMEHGVSEREKVGGRQ